MAGSTVVVKGLHELDRAFAKMSKDVREEFVWELQEAADPARRLATEVILGGGAGLPGMENMPRTPFYADMRIGVSQRESSVYIAPAWRRGRMGPRYKRPKLAGSFKKRMEAAVNETAPLIERRIGQMIDRMADEWGRAA